MTDANTLLTQLHDEMISEEYKAEVALELEGVERGIRNKAVMDQSVKTT